MNSFIFLSIYLSLSLLPSSFRLALTGTPLMNNITELFTLMSFLVPSVFREVYKRCEGWKTGSGKGSKEKEDEMTEIGDLSKFIDILTITAHFTTG